MNAAMCLLLARIHHDVQQYEQHHLQDQEHHAPAGRRRRTVWVRNYLTEERRMELGHFHSLLDLTMRDLDLKMFRNYTRLTPDIFLEVLDNVRVRITKQDTYLRNAIEPGLKLAVTLRYLATGDSYRSLSYAFRVGVSTISTFLPEVCLAIFLAFKRESFQAEWSEDGWKAIADKFNTRWNMPHTMGALDGKHVAIKKPANTGTLYHNYKGFFSIPFLALVDADYKFLWAELGGMGHMSDAQIFMGTTLREDLEDGSIRRPAPCPLTDDPEDTTLVPFFILSDDAFALKDYCMKPYSKNTMDIREVIFNYRLSRARRVVENAFGLLAQRFRVLLRTCELKPENVRIVIKCALVLHNILLDRLARPADAVDREDGQNNVIPGLWREHVIWADHPQPRAGRANNAGKEVRETLADFFGSPAGIVPWQWEKAHVHPPARAADLEPVAPAPAAPPQSPPSSPE